MASNNWPPKADILSAAAAQSRVWSAKPAVSVVIPVFNKWHLTRACLRSVLRSDQALPLEVIVVDDGSSDETVSALARLPCVRVIENKENRGYVHSCNAGAAVANGKYLFFLNNDTVLEEDAIAALVRRAESDDTIAIVGSKLLYPDGTLQEAGAIVWSDGRAYNYGRHDDPEKSHYNFVRDVDYVSGAALLIRADVFDAVAGFDTSYAPAYYEDVDLCFSVRAAGKRVVYEPLSRVIHWEGATSGRDTSQGAKRFQEVNRSRFVEKWQHVLAAEYFEAKADSVERAARARGRYSSALLVVEDTLPRFDRDAAGERLWALLEGFLAANVRVVFYPHDLQKTEPYASNMQSRGIEVIHTGGRESEPWRRIFNAALSGVDAAWIGRPALCRYFLPVIREVSALPVVFDTIDLHYLRLQRAELLGEATGGLNWRSVRDLEIACGLASNATVVVSDKERAALADFGVSPLYVIPTIHDPVLTEPRNYFMTRGLLFIGGFKHLPNVDAALWLANEIMPLIRRAVPNITLTLLGSDPPPEIVALKAHDIDVPGYVADVSPFFQEARVFVAPLRYGAGIKGKIGKALAFRLPVVTTSIGAEGFNFRSGVDARIADDASSFASDVVDLYTDVDAWSAMSFRSQRVLKPFGSRTVVQEAQRLLREVRNPSMRAHTNP